MVTDKVSYYKQINFFYISTDAAKPITVIKHYKNLLKMLW